MLLTSDIDKNNFYKSQNIKDILHMASDIIKDSTTYRNFYAKYMDFAAKRIERLTSALYLVSELVPEKEPLKTLLREKGLTTMSDIFSIVIFAKAKGSKEDGFLKIMTEISEMTALLGVASASGFISEMNAGILQKEYASLRGFFESRCYDSEWQKFGEEIVLNENFFEKKEWPRLGDADRQDDKGQDKRHQITKGHIDVVYGAPREQRAVDLTKNRIQISEKTIDKSKDIHNENFAQEERKKTIVQIIKGSSGNASIKDISSHVKGCSEKTLQRDIIALMQKGILKKTGERRWSRYSLV